MRYFVLILFIVFSFAGNAQSPSSEDYRIINEILENNFAGAKVDLSSTPLDNRYFKIEYGWTWQEADVINKNLNSNEIIFILNLVDSSYCFSPDTRIQQTINLCDSSELKLYDLFKGTRTKLGSSVTWDASKISSGMGKSKLNIFQISEVIYNNEKSVALVHIIFSGKKSLFGETILLKKIDGKWKTICNLSSWIT